MKTFYAQKSAKLSQLMIEYYDGRLNYATAMKLLRKKEVKVDGVRVKNDQKIEIGSKIEVYFDGEDKVFAPRVIFSDQNIVVVYKPTAITTEDFAIKMADVYSGAVAVHRLDRNTDGIIIFALNSEAENQLLLGFKGRTFKKVYLAEVYGSMPKESDILTAYLKKDSEISKVEIFDSQVKGSEKIITAYKSIKRGETSLIEVELVTGKTHQIRAHLAYLGNFILGDGKYGKESINRKFGAKTQRLTAIELTLKFEESSPLYYLDGKTFKMPKELLRFGKIQ